MRIPLVPLEVPNPLDGLSPGLGPLADALGPKVSMLLAIVWFIAIAAAVAFLIIGIVSAASAGRRHDPDGMSGAAVKIGVPAVALVLLAIAPLIVSALIAT